MKTCSLDGCDRKHEAHGWCRVHYRRWKKWGDPLKVGDPKPYEGRSEAEVRNVLMSRRRVTEAGCWEYTGTIAASGYGQISYEGRQTTAHRLAYRLFVGPIPDGHHVCHRCDNRPCFNPDHLFTGTAADNNADMDAKGRANRLGFSRLPAAEERARGEDNGEAKLVAAQVLDILASEESQRVLADRYGVSKALIGRIKRRELWRHL